MKEENKELLLKDLCGRLPYQVKCNIGENIPYTLCRIEKDDMNGHLLDFIETKNGLDVQVYLSECKPYLFPLSSMSTSERNEIVDLLGCDFPWHISEGKLTWTVGGSVESESFELTIDQLERLMHIFNSRHYDYRGLIGKHLANDATGLGIYKQE